jgi:hypothetical protein
VTHGPYSSIFSLLLPDHQSKSTRRQDGSISLFQRVQEGQFHFINYHITNQAQNMPKPPSPTIQASHPLHPSRYLAHPNYTLTTPSSALIGYTVPAVRFYQKFPTSIKATVAETPRKALIMGVTPFPTLIEHIFVEVSDNEGFVEVVQES